MNTPGVGVVFSNPWGGGIIQNLAHFADAVIPPVIKNISPSITFDVDPATPISFDVVSDAGLSSTMILCLPTMFVDQASGAPELVHNGTTFSPLYLKHSTRTAISHGFHYVVLRDGGWPTPPVLGLYVANNVAGVLVI
jgi:hypothetical protein